MSAYLVISLLNLYLDMKNICPPKNINVSFLHLDCISSNVPDLERLSKKVFQKKGLIPRGLTTSEDDLKRNMMVLISIIAEYPLHDIEIRFFFH